MAEIRPDVQTAHFGLAKAITACGSQTNFAQMIGVSQGTVSKWLRSSEGLPAKFLAKVTSETLVPKEELRPDLPWDDNPLPSLPPISTTDEVAQ